jgi:hypothetical protein
MRNTKLLIACLFSILATFNQSYVLATNLQDIEDKLDDMEFERQMREINRENERLIDQIERDNQRQRDQIYSTQNSYTTPPYNSYSNPSIDHRKESSDSSSYLWFLVIGGGIAYYLYKNKSDRGNLTSSDIESLKVFINCPQCNERYKAPPNKALECTCNKCKHVWIVNT